MSDDKDEKCPSCGDHHIKYSELNGLYQCMWCGTVWEAKR
jgi:uncharacterized Zn finger protein